MKAKHQQGSKFVKDKANDRIKMKENSKSAAVNNGKSNEKQAVEQKININNDCKVKASDENQTKHPNPINIQKAPLQPNKQQKATNKVNVEKTPLDPNKQCVDKLCEFWIGKFAEQRKINLELIKRIVELKNNQDRFAKLLKDQTELHKNVLDKLL
jgi:hypothetical protein